MSSVLAVQAYTIRDFLKTPADARAALHRVKQMGYDAVQMSGYQISAGAAAEILRDEGLICCAAHAPLEKLRDHTQQVIDDLQLMGCRYVAVGGYFPREATAGDWAQYARHFNDIARRFQGSGIALGYHNHSHELVRYGKTTALDILIQTFSPDVWLEIDTYWIQHGGGDPAAWIAKVAGRLPCVHLKDMAVTLQRQPLMAEVGEGNLNWPAILAACKNAGVQWYAVEQDICQRDPFESLAISLRNLHAMGMH